MADDKATDVASAGDSPVQRKTLETELIEGTDVNCNNVHRDDDEINSACDDVRHASKSSSSADAAAAGVQERSACPDDVNSAEVPLRTKSDNKNRSEIRDNEDRDLLGRAGFRRVGSLRSSVSPQKHQDKIPKTDEPNDELSKIFKRRSFVAESGEKEKSVIELENRIRDEKRRLETRSLIVDDQLSEVLKTRRKRVDSSSAEQTQTTCSTTLDGSPIEYEQKIEVEIKRRKSLIVETDNDIDQQLNQVLKARRERISTESTPNKLSREDLKILRERRRSGMSPQNSVTSSPRDESVDEADAPPAGGRASVDQTSPATNTSSVRRRKPLSSSQSFDSPLTESDPDRNRRSLRQTRPVFQKENRVESTTSLDPQLEALLKLRKAASSCDDDDMSADVVGDALSCANNLEAASGDKPKRLSSDSLRQVRHHYGSLQPVVEESYDRKKPSSVGGNPVSRSASSPVKSYRPNMASSALRGHSDVRASRDPDADAGNGVVRGGRVLTSNGANVEKDFSANENSQLNADSGKSGSPKEKSEVESKRADGLNVAGGTSKILSSVINEENVDDSSDGSGTESSNKRKIDRKKARSDRYSEERKLQVSAQLATSSQASSDDVNQSTGVASLSEQDKAMKTTSLTDLPQTSRTPIAARTAALQKNANEDWKRRAVGPGLSPAGRGDGDGRPVSIADRLSKLSNAQEDWKLKVSDSGGSGRPVSIADRLSKLSVAQDDWKQKVPDKDAAKFTTKGKMDLVGIGVDSPVTKAQKRTPRQSGSKGSESSDASELLTPMSPDNEIVAATEKIVPTVVKIEVPQIDDEGLTVFFGNETGASTRSTASAEKVDVSIDAFDDIFIQSNDILMTTKRIKPKRTNAGNRNPLKTMSLRTDLVAEYVEIKDEDRIKDAKRFTVVAGSHKTELAREAKEGLASTEDFSKLSLRKAESFSHPNKYRPYNDNMLILVKGRRYCQSRLVVPVSQSVNSGDCYLLVTPDCVYLWLGQYSNVIERSKAAEMASQIQQKHDLGVKLNADLVTINEDKQSILRGAGKFWKALGSADVCTAQAPGKPEEDEMYEQLICETNRVYRVVNDVLVEADEYSGGILKHEMLRSKDAYVFDFGSEFYVWTGKHVPVERRKLAVQLANEMWEKNFDFSEYSVNPLSPLLAQENGGLAATGEKRPSWTVFGKVSQNMETILFKEKFTDWPDAGRLIRVKEPTGKSKHSSVRDSTGLTSFDVSRMINSDETPVSLLLEGSHVGRGDAWIDYEDGIRREFEIRTDSVKVWHVSEFSRQLLEGESSRGQFHDEDAYVVCWHYTIIHLTHTLGGAQSRQGATAGRARCAYFFWHGHHCGVGEKGSSALMTVELDKEKGPQIPVEQGKEPPCFIRLFDGQMVVHAGKRDSAPTARWSLYVVRNELPEEAYLWEIPVEICNLRSRSSFVIADRKKSILTVWHGCKSSKDVVSIAKDIADRLAVRCPAEFGLQSSEKIVVAEVKEGCETSDFWEIFGGEVRTAYTSLLNDVRLYEFTPRMFHMSSSSGAFDVEEILNPARWPDEDDLYSAFPFLQSDVYCAKQPALFMIDNRYEVFLWQGWWPSAGTNDVDNAVTGMADTRFNVTRRCAMQTTLDYCHERYPSDSPPAYLIHAGKEPQRFKNLFPYWQNDDAVIANANESSIPEEPQLVSVVLENLTRHRIYSWEELQERPLPEGVDPQLLECYLGDEEFEELFGMTRGEFDTQPKWQQIQLKKDAGLF